MRQLKSAVLAAGVLGFCLQSHAAAPVAEANIDWTSFSYQLFDLDPLDGVAASLTWGGQGSSTSAGYFGYSASDDWSFPLQSADGVSYATANEGGLAAVTSSNNTVVDAYAHRWGDFTLSAKTLVVFSVSGSVSVVGDSDFAAYRSAAVRLNVTGYDIDTYFASQSGLSVGQYYGGPSNKSGIMSLSFVNLTDSGRTAYMYAYAQADAAAPIPEPHTYGLMLAGLAVMSSVVRRRCKG